MGLGKKSREKKWIRRRDISKWIYELIIWLSWNATFQLEKVPPICRTTFNLLLEKVQMQYLKSLWLMQQK